MAFGGACATCEIKGWEARLWRVPERGWERAVRGGGKREREKGKEKGGKIGSPSAWRGSGVFWKQSIHGRVHSQVHSLDMDKKSERGKKKMRLSRGFPNAHLRLILMQRFRNGIVGRTHVNKP